MKNFLIFIAGFGIGATISLVYNKNKYEQMVQEEVESLRELNRKGKNSVPKNDVQINIKDDADVDNTGTIDDLLDIDNSAERAYEESMKKARDIIDYSGYSKREGDINDEPKDNPKNPIYVITPDDFASEVGYDTDSFYIFEDDIIADGDNKVVDNVLETFGMSVTMIREQFGIHEDDAVYIRDERTKMDYEILRELEAYEKRDGE